MRISDWSSDVCSSDLAGTERAQIIDLVPHHDPDIGVPMRLRRRGIPMAGRDLLDPLDPHRIVDMAELVDGVGGGGEGEGEAFHLIPSTPPLQRRGSETCELAR